MSDKKLTRVSNGKLLGGVCAGLGKYTNLNAWIFRILFILFGCSGLGIVIYLLMCFAIPQE